MPESARFKCPCKICFSILLIVIGVKLLAAELKGNEKKEASDHGIP
jgi:hypothetical protein